MQILDNEDLQYKKIDEYFYTISHELKAPFNEILTYAQIISEDNIGIVSEQSLRDLQSIQDICKNSLNMVQMFMKYLKIRNQKINYELVDLGELIRQCFTKLTISASLKHVELNLNPLPKVIGDRFLFQQMVINLLSNSLKFTSKREHPTIHIYSVTESTSTKLYFEDNGIGISSEYIEKVFNIFESTSDVINKDGNGIGLSLVKTFVDKIGGQVEISSVKDHNFTVIVSIPNQIVITPDFEQKIIEKKKTTIRIGVLGAITGDYSNIAPCRKYAYELAVEEINAAGGINGKKIELLFRDFKSDIDSVSIITWDLIAREQVDIIMGGQLSSAREYIREITGKMKVPYFFNELYEGGIADHYTFCISASPEQNIYPMIDQLFPIFGSKCYIIAADYNYGVLSAECVKNYIEKKRGVVIGNEYFSSTKTDYASTIDNIKKADPDIIISFCVSNNQSDFYRQWYKYGTHNIPVISTISIGLSHLHKTLPSPVMKNTFFMSSYLEELDTEAAIAFTEKLRRKYTKNEVPYIEFDAETAYTAVYLYKKAVEMAGSTDTEAVIKALESGEISFDGPGGKVTVRGEDHHVIRDEILFRVNKEHSVEKVISFESLKPYFVEETLSTTTGVKGGLKTLGLNAPNLQYSILYNRTI
ncbi:ABC transporter substrate-binding protein [Frisingicoccus sp.]|uniref:ABC transporter substrate-binding protein n=1 Tax=Frisingicoccus sp. TaxID=1918627 RepID=UPI003AB21F4F